jgi:hypothetical protein
MIHIYGASDDLLEVEGNNPGCDEYGCPERGIAITIGDETGGLRVFARYAVGPRGVWRLAVEPIDEGVPIPWPVRVEMAESGYSCAVVVDCPVTVPVRVAKTRKKARGQ